jgi:hypothetical protein
MTARLLAARRSLLGKLKLKQPKELVLLARAMPVDQTNCGCHLGYYSELDRSGNNPTPNRYSKIERSAWIFGLAKAVANNCFDMARSTVRLVIRIVGSRNS